MPVKKFKTFEEAERDLWNFYPDENYYKRVADLWNFANELNPIRHPRGVFKFKTIEDANRHRNDFMFQLTSEEKTDVVANCNHLENPILRVFP